MIVLQKLGGVAALLEAILYMSAFIFFGAFWDFPTEVGVAQQLAFLKENQVTLTILNIFLYVVFGIFLALLVLALHEHLKGYAPALSKTASVFGFIWVGLVIASGMIANIGLKTVIELSEKEPEQARSVWLAVDSVAEGIGGGNEIVGGLWVLLLSIAALKNNVLSKKLNYLGLFVGLAGIFTIYPADILTEIFGLSQTIWFVWLGLIMLLEPSEFTESLNLD
ncbi:hypothetical protein [Vibrio sp. F74]|uniref:hypothetical protein n=1 Tax=Vibrio sp. F74 TaxID=700020 RepID=UPI0035F53D1A